MTLELSITFSQKKLQINFAKDTKWTIKTYPSINLFHNSLPVKENSVKKDINKPITKTVLTIISNV